MPYPTVPIQVRSIDPYDKRRTSREQNLKSRVLTMGRSVILYETSSFAPTIYGTAKQKIRISPGLCIIDDVLIHIENSWTIDITNGGISEGQNPNESPTYHMIDHNNGLNEYDFIIDAPNNELQFIYIKYDFYTSQPSPSAKIYVTRFPQILSSTKYLYLGHFEVQDNSYVPYVLTTGATYTEDNVTKHVYRKTLTKNAFE